MGFRFLAFSESSRLAQSGGLRGHERPEAILLLQDTSQLKNFTRMRVLRLECCVVAHTAHTRTSQSHASSFTVAKGRVHGILLAGWGARQCRAPARQAPGGNHRECRDTREIVREFMLVLAYAALTTPPGETETALLLPLLWLPSKSPA